MIKKLFIFGVIMLAISALSTIVASDKPEEDREPTLEERCAWLSIRRTIEQYPGGMAEFVKYEITDSKYFEKAKVVTVQGNLDYLVSGQKTTVPFAKTCYLN